MPFFLHSASSPLHNSLKLYFSIEENAKAILEEQKQDEKFSEIIVSCKSLSGYETKSFKTLLPQVSNRKKSAQLS